MTHLHPDSLASCFKELPKMPVSQDQIEQLQAASVLQGIPNEYVAKLAAIATFDEFVPFTTIFHEHDPAKSAYVVLEGTVSLAICNPRIGCRQMMQLGPGEMFGWSAIVARPRLSDTATTLTRCRLARFDGQTLRLLCDSEPELGYLFMRRTCEVLVERLGALRQQLMDVCGLQLPSVQVSTD